MAAWRRRIHVLPGRRGAQLGQEPILIWPSFAPFPLHEETLDHLVESIERIPCQPIPAAQTVDAHGHEFGIAQNPQLIRDRRLTDVELGSDRLDQTPDGFLTGREELDDSESDRVPEQSEDMHPHTLGTRRPAASPASTAHQETGSALPSS